MVKLVRLNPKYWPAGSIGHWCPGCDQGHDIAVDAPNSSGARWTFDGNAERPTFSPSINIRSGKYADPSFVDPDGYCSSICHYFIRAGKIEFCADSTHHLSGKTVDLPDIPAGKYLTSQPL